MSILLYFLTSPLGLPITPWWEWLLLLLAGEVAFRIAWTLSPGGRLGRIVHWPLRLLTYIIVWAIMRGIIVGSRFVSTHWIWFTTGLLVISVFALVWVAVHKIGSGNNNDDDER